MNSSNCVYNIDECTGERIDTYLARIMPGVSRSHVQKLIAEGNIQVSDRIIKANYKLQKGDCIRVTIPEAKNVEINAEAIPLEILYEDTDVIVINKSRGMVVHPAAGNFSGTLVNALLDHCDDLSGINGEIRPGIVHRLDKDTSGVMVVAKNDSAHIDLAKQIKERTASRLYLAIVHGNLKEDNGIINAPIGRHPADRKKMAVVFSNSKEAVTYFKVIERFGNYTLVECKLMTGRTHQIRVHMNYIGHPVVGDPKYGPEKKHFSIKGQALHSKQLKFRHPSKMQEMVFSAPLPADMEKILTQIRHIKK
ncbi:RluA family pseudouridine synthase [Dendrosporobacter sp. 1207_IL3150]|uniref:RluA family pseudouridine synthase n=1 Tax=Dendrosporobacter sp. 1207_IL3150 TaxID=3084054 RepID=UPI002FD8DD6A